MANGIREYCLFTIISSHLNFDKINTKRDGTESAAESTLAEVR